MDINWNPILEDEIITQIMVTVRDMTEIIELENEAEEQKMELQTIQRLLNIKSNIFQNFHKSTLAFLDEGKNLITNTSTENKEAIDSLFRNMHTIKGNSRTLGFVDISNIAHEAESLYAITKATPELHLNKELAKNHLEQIAITLERYKLAFDKMFHGNRFDSGGEDLLISKRELLASIPNLGNNPEFTNLVLHKTSPTLLDLLNPILTSLSSIAVSLGKPAPEVTTHTQGIRIHEEAISLITDIFTHLLRNCIDHGIEEPATRLKHGKNPYGSIHITSEIVSSQDLCIFVSDDGQGLNLPFLRAKSIAEHHGNDTPTDDEVASNIFESGVSSKTNVTEISGRGIGLSAVRNYLKEKNCKIELTLGPPNNNMNGYRLFKIQITIPKSLYFLESGRPALNKKT